MNKQIVARSNKLAQKHAAIGRAAVDQATVTIVDGAKVAGRYAAIGAKCAGAYAVAFVGTFFRGSK